MNNMNREQQYTLTYLREFKTIDNIMVSGWVSGMYSQGLSMDTQRLLPGLDQLKFEWKYIPHTLSSTPLDAVFSAFAIDEKYNFAHDLISRTAFDSGQTISNTGYMFNPKIVEGLLGLLKGIEPDDKTIEVTDLIRSGLIDCETDTGEELNKATFTDYVEAFNKMGIGFSNYELGRLYILAHLSKSFHLFQSLQNEVIDESRVKIIEKAMEEIGRADLIMKFIEFLK